MIRKIFPLSLVAFTLPASAEDFCFPSPEEFCLNLTEPAVYYFDAIAFGGISNGLLNRWLEQAAMSYAVTTDPQELATTKDHIADLGARIERGEYTNLDGMAVLFNACVERHHGLRE